MSAFSFLLLVHAFLVLVQEALTTMKGAPPRREIGPALYCMRAHEPPGAVLVEFPFINMTC